MKRAINEQYQKQALDQYLHRMKKRAINEHGIWQEHRMALSGDILWQFFSRKWNSPVFVRNSVSTEKKNM